MFSVLELCGWAQSLTISIKCLIQYSTQNWEPGAETHHSKPDSDIVITIHSLYIVYIIQRIDSIEIAAQEHLAVSGSG